MPFYLNDWIFPRCFKTYSATRATSKRSLSFVIKKSAASPLNITTDLRWVSKQLPPWPSDARTIHELQPWGWRRNDHTGCCGYHIHYKLRFSKLKTTNLSILSFLFFFKEKLKTWHEYLNCCFHDGLTFSGRNLQINSVYKWLVWKSLFHFLNPLDLSIVIRDTLFWWSKYYLKA